MAHQHTHHHDEKRIRGAFYLNLAFTLIEIAGGLLTHSLAILSDALHDLGDSVTLGLSWYFQKISKKESNRQFSYGYRRFSLLGAVINAVVLAAGSFFILSRAIPGIFHPGDPDARGMLYLAILGVLVNGAAVLRMKGGHSINERVVSLHLLEDVLGWAAVLIVSIVMMAADLPVLDPLLSVFISLFVLFNVYKHLKASLRIILQAAPEEVNSAKIEKQLRQIPQILDVHDLHLWTLDGEYHIMSVHLVVNQAMSLQQMAQLKSRVRTALNRETIEHITMEIESEEEVCGMADCLKKS